MNRQTVSLGRIFGIPVAIDYSWFLIFALLTWTMAVSYYPSEFTDWTNLEYWLVGAVTAILLFGSVLLHELGHSLVALQYRIPVRSIRLYIFGGISQISEEPKSALSELWITIAGPCVSFILAGILFLLIPLFSGVEPLLALAKYLASINLMLGIFNLIPGFPLDGGGVLMSIIWGITHNRHRAILIAAYFGRFIAYLFILFGVYLMTGGNLMNGLWIAFIGWFMLNAAGGRVQQERIQALLAGHKASEALSRGYTAIQADTTLQYLVDDHILGGNRRSFIVEKGDEVVGLLTLHHFQNIPKDQWSVTTAAQAMLPTAQIKQISPDTEIWEAIKEMDRDGVNQLPVMADNRIQGVLTREDIISFLQKSRTIGS